MKFFWQQKNRDSVPSADSGASVAAGSQACPTLGKVLEKLLRHDGAAPRVLDLGPFSGDSAVFLAGLGARVTVGEFDHLPHNRSADPAGDEPDRVVPTLRLDADDGSFDLVLAWEHFDFLPRPALAEFSAELRRILGDGGWLLFFARNPRHGQSDTTNESPRRFRIVDNDRLLLSETGWSSRVRYAHPTRVLESSVHPMRVSGIHLQRDQTREFLVQKPAGY